jgi:hypothetical protein
VLDKRPAISELGASFNESTGISTGLNKMAEQSHRKGVSHMQSSQQHLSSALSQYQSIAENHRNDKNLTNAWVHGESVMKDSALSTLDSASKELSDALTVDVQAANQLLFNGKGDVGASVGIGSQAGVKANVSANAGLSVGHEERTLNAEQQRVVENIQRKYDVQNLLKKAENESKEGRYAVADSSGNQYDAGIRASLDEGLSQQKMAQASFAKEEAYRESAQFAANSSVESTQNLSQKVFEQQVQRDGGVENTIDKLSTSDGVKEVREAFISTHTPALEQQFAQQKVYNTPEKLEQQYQKDVEQIKTLNHPQDEYEKNKAEIIEQANKKDLNKTIESDMPEKMETASKQAEQQIQAQQKKFDKKKDKMEKRYQEFSEDNKVNDYSTKFKNLFRGKSAEKTTGKLDDE